MGLQGSARMSPRSAFFLEIIKIVAVVDQPGSGNSVAEEVEAAEAEF